MQKTDHQHFAVGVQQGGGGVGHLPAIDRRQDLALGAHALIDLEPVAALDQGLEIGLQAIGRGTVAPAQLQHVAKPRGGDQAATRATALDHGICRHRGTVNDQLQCLERHRQGLGSGQQAVGGLGRGWQFCHGQPALDQVDDVGMGAADIDAEQVGHGSRPDDDSLSPRFCLIVIPAKAGTQVLCLFLAVGV